MTHTLEFSINQSDEENVAQLLQLCDGHFIPPLSERVHIAMYVEKITKHAERVEAWSDNNLIGLVAIYCNDKKKFVAFITNVCVSPYWQGLGVASRLLSLTIDFLHSQKFKSIELEVNRHNYSAISLYERKGFSILNRTDDSIFMCKNME